MIGSLRKFSNSIYAKILLGIMIIPFIFWGMGSSFIGGNKNVIVVIDKEKYSIQEFGNFIQKFTPTGQQIDAEQIEKLLSNFIGDKLIEKEVERFNIKLSDDSLSKLIKYQETFKKENKFSRIEYEKFLLKNNITAVNFEANLSKHEKKEQLLDFIAGGISPSKFLVNIEYDKINQKRNIDVINLNDVFKEKLNFSENQIKSHFENNKDDYKEIYKSVKFLELNPKKLTGNDEFNDLFFKKIDEIDDLAIQGNNINYIIQKFNLEKANSSTFNEFGKDKNSKIINNFPKDLIKNTYDINDSEPTVLIEYKNKYFIVEVIKTENIQKEIEDESVRNEILLSLEEQIKRKLITEIISKINKNNFKKFDFVKLAKNKNILITQVRLENQNDDRILKRELINQIYKFSEKSVIVVHDVGLSENFLIYIDKIENVSIDENSEEYEKYLNLSKVRIKNGLYNTYDYYLKKKYKIDVNYQALDTVKNSFIY